MLTLNTAAPERPVITELLALLIFCILAMGSLALGYWLQGYPAATGASEPLSGLMFFTLAAGVAIGVGAVLYFLRKRRNRDIAQHALIES